jgi:hypothetical protein
VREEDVEVVIMRYDMTLRDYEPAISPLPSFASSSDQANPKKWITPDSSKLGDLLLFRRQIIRGIRGRQDKEGASCLSL